MIEFFYLLLIVIIITAICGKVRGNKLDAYQHYLHKYYFAVEFYENEYKHRGINGDVLKLRIGSLSESEVAQKERLIVSEKFNELIFFNPLRRKYFRQFVYGHTFHRKNMTKLPIDIGACEDSYFSEDYFIKKYSLLQLNDLDKYIKDGAVFK